MDAVDYDFSKIPDSYLERLAREHVAIDDLCNQSDVITYEILEKEREKPYPPNAYMVTFRVKSIIGKNDTDQSPIYGNLHKTEIRLPENYPMASPICYMRTDLWHPNIKFHGNEKGHICSNIKGFGKRFNLYFLVHRIGEILQYQNYHAIPDESPHPDDEIVAQWVREYAEPRGIVNKDKDIAVDDTPLLRPRIPKKKPEKKAGGITILSITKDEEEDEDNGINIISN